ncbi:Snaclec 6 [Orchesella cincta]|uniref:Snaclec 6 n=1 Tax=Orchesella cincta TaxID=48709 RepID=A0A1D2M756_ORCCI|nr:Snaclec 6 [Orchesella cincta]
MRGVLYSICILQIVIFTTQLENETQKGEIDDMLTYSFHYLGRVTTPEGEKMFIADDEERTWKDSQEYCDSRGTGFKMATLKTQSEVAFFKAVHSATNFFGAHWIGALLAQPPNSMSWYDKTDDTIGNLNGIVWENLAVESVCGAYFSDQTTPKFQTIDCSTVHKVICQQIL